MTVSIGIRIEVEFKFMRSVQNEESGDVVEERQVS